MRLFILFLIILFTKTYNVASQPVDFKNPDLPLLERLTVEAVNNVRKKHNCESLPFNAILYRAAKNHASYLKTHELGHIQPENPALETVKKRVAYYGGKDYYPGENVLMTTLTANHNVFGQKARTYKQMAKALASGWVNSPGHFQNMITPHYSKTAVAISYDPAKRQFFAVQVFAFMAEDVYPQENVIKSLKKYPHNLKLMPPEKRKVAAAIFENLQSLSLTKVNNRLVMVLMDKQEARDLQELIRKRRDGLVIEKVVFDPYRCGNPAYENQPARRNGRYFLNGDLLKPLFSKNLYQQLAKVHVQRFRKPTPRKERKLRKSLRKQRRKVPYWLVDLGIATDANAAYNLMLIRKNRLVAVNKFYSLPGKILPAGPLPEMQPYWLPGHFNFSPGTTEIILEIPFELNQSRISENKADQLLLIDSLKKLNIKKVAIEAFASVEGDLEINEELHKKRATFIQTRLQQHLNDSTIRYQLKTGENWPEFARQIRHTPYTYLLRQNKNKVKEYLSTTQNDTIKMLLQKQRKAVARVTFLDTSGQYDTLSIVSNEWDSLINLTGKKMPQQYRVMIVRKLEVLQKFLYNYYLDKGKGDLSTLVNKSFPREPLFAQLINNRNWFLSKLNLKSYPVDAIDIAYCAENFAEKDVGKYNFIIYHLQKQNSIKKMLEKIAFHYKRLNWSYYQKDEKRKIAFNLFRRLTMIYSRDLKDYDEMQRAFQQTMSNFSIINQKDSVAAAKMYVEFGQEKKAYFLIKPLVKKGGNDKQLLIFFLKLALQLPVEKHYKLLKQHQKELSNEEWCNLFRGGGAINFQVFDYAPLRKLYCQTCNPGNL